MMVLLLATVASAATLHGRLVDATTGDPIAGAAVEAWDPRLRGFSDTTDSDGAFVLPLESEGPWRLRAVPRYDDPHVWRMADGTAEFCDSAPIWLHDDLDYGDIPLPLGQTVTGTVVDELGDPIPGATVWLLPDNDLTSFDRPALTETDGTFEIVGIDTTTAGTDWTLQAGADGWPDQYLGDTYDRAEAEVVTLDSHPTPIGTMDLLPGIFVSGTVSGPDGPVSSGTVHTYSSSQVVTVEIDDDGRYEAMGLPPGDVLNWANSPGLAQTYLPDTDRPGATVAMHEEGDSRDDLHLQLPEEAIFEFEFIDAHTGEPVVGPGGLLYNDAHTVGFGNVADDDGLLVIDRLHGGDWTLYVWGADDGYADDWIRTDDGEEQVFSIDEADTQRVVVPLERSARLAGQVVDDSGHPVDGIAITAIRDDGSGLAATSNPDGTFVLGGLGAGVWTVSVTYTAICPGDPGYVTTHWPGTPNGDWARPLTLGPGEQRTDILFKVPTDADLDEMADDWERHHGLDPANPDDALEDPDGDTYTNLDEYRMGTDPFNGTPKVEQCGCHTSPSRWSLAWLPLVLLAAARRRP